MLINLVMVITNVTTRETIQMSQFIAIGFPGSSPCEANFFRRLQREGTCGHGGPLQFAIESLRAVGHDFQHRFSPLPSRLHQ